MPGRLRGPLLGGAVCSAAWTCRSITGRAIDCIPQKVKPRWVPTGCAPQNLRGDRFQQVVMMQAAEAWPSNDTMSGS
jgi:hypothetical protein